MDEPAVVVGRVMKAHGVHGEVAVRNRSDNPERWVADAVVFLPDGRRLTVASARPHADRLLVSFAEVTDRGGAEAIRGKELSVPVSWLPALPEGQWWPHDLEGCVVRTESGRALGELRSVEFNPANDIWVVVDDPGTETLIPALRWILVEVDVTSKRIVVRDVPGITEPGD